MYKRKKKCGVLESIFELFWTVFSAIPMLPVKAQIHYSNSTEWDDWYFCRTRMIWWEHEFGCSTLAFDNM